MIFWSIVALGFATASLVLSVYALAVTSAARRRGGAEKDEVLLALHEGETHGYGIMERVNRRTNGRVILGPSRLYGCLKSLLDRGVIEETGSRPDPELDAEERRHFRLTPAGERAALEAAGAPADGSEQRGGER